MKKLLALLLALAMLLSLTACAAEEEEKAIERREEVEFEETDEEKSLLFDVSGDGREDAEDAEDAEEAEETAETEETEETGAAPGADAPAAEMPAVQTVEIPGFEPSGPVPAAFEQRVLLDDEYCTVTLVGYEPDSDWGAELELELVNKTDTEIMFAARDTLVNGIMFDPYWANSVDAGVTETSYVTFDREDMEDYGINYLQEVLLGFDVYNNEDWSADHYFSDFLTILLPAAGSGSPNSALEMELEGLTVVNNEDVAIAIVEHEEDGYYGPELKVLMINRTDKSIYVGTGDCAVNGVMINASHTVELLPNAIAYRNISWDNEDLEEVGINYLKDVRLFFDVNTVGDYDNVFKGGIAFTLEGGSGPAVEEVFYDGFPETVLAEGDGFAVTAKNFSMEGYWGPTLTLYLENETDDKLWFDVDTAWINGVELDPIYTSGVLDHAVRYGKVDWYEDDFAEAGITSVESIVLRLSIREDSSGDTIYEGEVPLALG